jgi:hypothetical protein
MPKTSIECPPGKGEAIVFGMPHEDMFPARFMDKAGPNRLRFADLTGTRSQTTRFLRVLNDAVLDLAERGIEVKQRRVGGPSAPIGTGRYAHVYALKGRSEILKVSGDRTEAVAWKRILDAIEDGEISWSQLPSLAKVHCVYRVIGTRKRDRDLYVILMDRYRRLKASDRAMVDCIDQIILMGDNLESCLHAPYLARTTSIKEGRRRRGVQDGESKATNFIETMQNLAKIGVFIYDVHGDNVMMGPDGGWKITDIGVSEVSSPVLMETL